MLPGVYPGKRKDGTSYFRSNFTYKNKHISLGSYETEELAFKAYLDARKLIRDDSFQLYADYSSFTLDFVKIISILNFRDN